eukprot:CAMPEP_0197249664 /NCGR_PEP_ID=MMETSP1429-20130617/48521_1 /TAXON_ID=49237 /ORGANISM="Chaetoceros  sp., Strain UNC1202" /LENGTH=266 /DNA_ID=CAMNT_0042711261 /DNA_START=51 /DNA_END=851 /DNA_ORIENTATION=+
MSTQQVQQCCNLAIIRKANFDSWYTGGGERHRYSWPRSILPRSERTAARRLAPCLASSQDQPNEIISNVLWPMESGETEENWEEIASGNPHYDGCLAQSSKRWWSSGPSELHRPEDTREDLLFVSKLEDVIVTEIAIKALKDPFGYFNGAQDLVYSWPYISFSVYRVPKDVLRLALLGPSEEEGEYSSRGMIDDFVKEHTPTYTHPRTKVKRADDSWQIHGLPDGVVGNVIVVTLWGKSVKQFANSGYYVCVEKLAMRGCPIVGNE